MRSKAYRSWVSCVENDIVYLTGNKGPNFCIDFFGTAPL